ncbi:unnamed protein product, partial [Musa hybrid cultivar]
KDESTYEWGRRASPAHAVPHAFPRIPLLPRPPLPSRTLSTRTLPRQPVPA